MSARGERLYRVLLRLLPRAFRERYQEQLVEVYRHRRARNPRGLRGRLALWRHLIGDLLRSTIRERRHVGMGPPASAGVQPRRPGWRRLLDGLRWDLRRALGLVVRSPAVTVIVVATIAIGVGANTLILSLMEATFLQRSAYREPERLVWIESFSEHDRTLRSSNLLDFRDWRAETASFEDMAAFWGTTLTVAAGELPERMFAAIVTASYFDVAGVEPLLGRSFTVDEETYGRNRVIVLSHGLWQQAFGGDPGVLGRTLRVEGVERTVVGVMPPGFPGPSSRVRLWAPMAFPADNWRASDRNSRWMDGVLARVAPGVAVEQADAELRAVSRAMAARYPDTNGAIGARARPWLEVEHAEVRPALVALGAGVGLLLLLGCANVASLLLARAGARRREIALCSALGAGRGRLLRQLMVEAGVLGLLGGALGVVLARALLGPAVALSAGRVRGLGDAEIDGSTLAFALALSLASSLLFGAWPAWRLAGRDGHVLRDASDRSSGATRGLRVLTGVEVTLATLLLCCALLLGKSFERLLRFDPGFDARGVLALDVALIPSDYPTNAAVIGYYERLLEALAGLPGVEGVAASTYEQPLAGSGWWVEFGVVGEPVPERKSDIPAIRYAQVSPDYFRVLGVPLRRGRPFNIADRADARPVAILNEAAVRRFFGGQEAVGEEIWLWSPDDTRAEVVGVAGDLRVAELRTEPVPTVYVPLLQASHGLPSDQTLLLRASEQEPAAQALLARTARERARELDRRQPVEETSSLEGLLVSSLGLERLSAALALAFAGVAVLLAGVGLYGAVSYSVSRHRREIGIRMALGGRARAVALEAVGDVLRPVGVGMALGLAGALLAGRLLASRLFGIAPHDPATLASVLFILVIVALAGAVPPFRRAVRVDPVESLRAE